jgi:hypothetical protein
MSHRLIAFLLLGGFASLAAQTAPIRQNGAFLVRMVEVELTLHPAAGPNNVGNCLVVAPDGRAHLELRRQEFLNGRASLSSYEGVLNSKELDVLQAILVPPLDSFHWAKAKISRPSGIQEIGYFEWHGEAPANAAGAAEAWSRSALAMRPLIEWFHGLKSTFPWKRVGNPKSGVCGES